MRFFLFTLLLGAGPFLFSQPGKMNSALKMKLSEKNVPGEVYTLLVQGNMPLLRNLETEGAYTVNYSAGDIASINCDAKALSFLFGRKIISYAELPQQHLQPMNDTMVYRNRIKGVKLGSAPLSQPYDGSGTLLGFIDTGIDFSHKDFKDAQGNSRIRFLWDQVAAAGSTTPTPFNYGIEWTDTQINANQCTHSDMPYFGHGTHVAGIGAGNGLSNNTHEGCAPKADIIMVAVNFNKQGPVTADAVQYIVNKATQLGKPFVINASLGDYYGSHDGTDLESKLIDNLVANIPGRAMVAASGNAGHIKYHVKTVGNGVDTSFTWLSAAGNTFDYWFYADTAQVKNLDISVGADRINFSSLGRIPFQNYSYGLSVVQHDTLKHNGNRIGIIHNSSSINNSGVYELYIRIDADTTNLLWRVETKGTGLHHAWNFDFVSSSLPTVAQYPGMMHYVMPDTMYSMVSSFQCSDEIITVGNYVNLNSYYDVNDSLRYFAQTTGALVGSSSSGPTRDGRQKPDISASGHSTFSSMVLAMQASQISNSPETVAQGSFHIVGGGTSAASPIVAGLAALYLQAHPQATNREVKAAITNCAYTDVFTGAVPNYAWGHGKLDGLAAMVCGENLASLRENRLALPLSTFPNPFHEQVSLVLPVATKGHITIYNSEGKLLLSDSFEGNRYELRAAALKQDAPGLLLARIICSEGNYTVKLIRE